MEAPIIIPIRENHSAICLCTAALNAYYIAGMGVTTIATPTAASTSIVGLDIPSTLLPVVT
jgi:hypothetical protein